MRPTLSLLVLLAACAPAPANPPSPPDPAALKTAMDAIRTDYMRLVAAADAAGVAALYTEDAAIDLWGAPKMRGRAEIEAGTKAAFAIQKPVSLEIVATQTSGVAPGVAVEGGTWHGIDSVSGKLLHSWGRWITGAMQDSTGAWKLTYLMAFPDSQKTDK